MSVLYRVCSRKSLYLCINNFYRNQFQTPGGVIAPNVMTLLDYLHSCCIHTSCAVKKQDNKVVKEFDYVSARKRKAVVEVWKNMTVEELSAAMNMKLDHMFELLTFVDNAEDLTEPSSVIYDWSVLLDIIGKAGKRYRLRSEPKANKEIDKDVYPYPPADESKLVSRPPVVTIMGHVDHGKTTLLDYLRKSAIVDTEFGGITQHIGAFSVKVNSNSITFLDTPGHAAFSSMRSRGAHCTDIVVLVVAADDGVMEQTVESINMAKSANVPIIVAINKIDKGTADIERTKKMLMMQGLAPEDMGGEIQMVPISALKGTNIHKLAEAITVQAELADLKSDPDGFVEGVVIESKVDSHRGKLSTALVRRGTLTKGKILTGGLAWAKVRAMFDEFQQPVENAPPSTPVEIVGWRELPSPGDIIIEVESEKRAHEVIRYRHKMATKKKVEKEMPAIENKRKEHVEKYKQMLTEKRKEGLPYYFKIRRPREKETNDDFAGPKLNIVIKADVEGSLEALVEALQSYHDPLCKLDIVHVGIGSVSAYDIDIAESFNALIYNFNVDCLPEALRFAEKKQISIKPHNIIYRFLEDIKEEINSRLPPIEKEEILGEATVLQLFLITEGKRKNVPIAGCRCIKGELKRSNMYKVIRNGEVIHRGALSSMKNIKTEVVLIKKEQECGLRFEDSSIIFEPGDIIQAYSTYTVPQKIDWNPF